MADPEGAGEAAVILVELTRWCCKPRDSDGNHSSPAAATALGLDLGRRCQTHCKRSIYVLRSNVRADFVLSHLPVLLGLDLSRGYPI